MTSGNNMPGTFCPRTFGNAHRPLPLSQLSQIPKHPVCPPIPTNTRKTHTHKIFPHRATDKTHGQRISTGVRLFSWAKKSNGGSFFSPLDCPTSTPLDGRGTMPRKLNQGPPPKISLGQNHGSPQKIMGRILGRIMGLPKYHGQNPFPSPTHHRTRQIHMVPKTSEKGKNVETNKRPPRTTNKRRFLLLPRQEESFFTRKTKVSKSFSFEKLTFHLLTYQPLGKAQTWSNPLKLR